jgi:hypothetical protein
VAGNLVPDVMDKTLGWVLKLTPSRWLFHGLPVFAMIAVISRLFDLWAGGRVPWMAPFGPKPVKRLGPKPLAFWAVYLLPEVVGAVVLWGRVRETSTLR